MVNRQYFQNDCRVSAAVPFRQSDSEITETMPVNRTTPSMTYFRAEVQGRRVNTFIKKHLPLKMLFHCKKLCGSAPLREITVLTPVPSRSLLSKLDDTPDT